MGEVRESWRNIKRAPGYRVSNYGRVKSVDRTLTDGRQAGGQTLEQYRDDDGKWCVTIRGERVRVHTLVLEAWRGPRPFGQEGCHGPNGQDDNRVSQLRWDTHLENMRDKRRERKTGSEVGTYPYLVGTPETCEVQC